MPTSTARCSAFATKTRVVQRRDSKPSPAAVRPRDAKPHDGDPNKENGEDIYTKLTKLQGVLSKAELMADDIAQDFRTTPGAVQRPTPVQRPTVEAHEEQARLRKRTRRVKDPNWVRAALPGVRDVSIGAVAQGNVPVSIDDAKEFPLSPALADILAVLIEGEDADQDGFPPPRSIAELAKAYGVRRRRHESKQAVVVALGRLRDRLEMVGNKSPELVETVRHRGVRFRIRRKKP